MATLNDALDILRNASEVADQDAEKRRIMRAEIEATLSSCKSLRSKASEAVKQAEAQAERAVRSLEDSSRSRELVQDGQIQRSRGKTADQSRREEASLHKLDALLGQLPDGASVAVIGMRGSLCPITLGHVQCYVEARRIILNDKERKAQRPARLEHFDECLGVVSLNADSHVSAKLREKGELCKICIEDRQHLVELATAELAWLCLEFDDFDDIKAMRMRWPKLIFTSFDMNGADDVVKYSKWTSSGPDSRMITMGRPGSTAVVVDGMKKSGIDPDDGNCFLGPELPDISSTAARDASMRGDSTALLTMLHPEVAAWLLRRDGHGGTGVSGGVESQATVSPMITRPSATRPSAKRSPIRSDSAARLSAFKSTGAAVLSVSKPRTASPAPSKSTGAGNKKYQTLDSAPRCMPKRLAMSSGRREAGPRPSGNDAEPDYDQCVGNAWSLFLGKGVAAPPLGTPELREQLRAHVVEIDSAQVPAIDALKAMDALLQLELKQKEVVQSSDLKRLKSDTRLAVWKGDITILSIGGIVNAANEKGVGCFQPEHRCIDNVIHCAAGPALRVACFKELQQDLWKGSLPTGEVMVTAGYNLPSEYVLHVPGPVCHFGVEQPEMLARCYRNVLQACKVHSVRSVAFCCISTGIFGYPAASAAHVAVATVQQWLDNNTGIIDLVVFNVFSDSDLTIYQKLLS